MDEWLTQTPFRPPAPTPRRTPLGLFAVPQGGARQSAHDLDGRSLRTADRHRGGRARTRDRAERPLRSAMSLSTTRGTIADDLQRCVRAPGLKRAAHRRGRGVAAATADLGAALQSANHHEFRARHGGGVRASGAPLAPSPGRAGARHFARDDPVTLDVLERTIFTQGLARDPDALGRAITRYFEAIGPIDPLDVFGLPRWVLASAASAPARRCASRRWCG